MVDIDDTVDDGGMDEVDENDIDEITTILLLLLFDDDGDDFFMVE